MLFCQKWPFLLIFGFWGNLARKHRFLIIRKEKNAFYSTKVKFQKSPIKSKFSKGVSPWCLAKNGHFSPARNERFLKFLVEKNAFQTRKVKF